MKYYLAGPMTGIENYNYPRFAQAASNLRAKGFNIVSPMDLDHKELPGKVGSLQHAEYMRAGLKALLECDGIILMGGWQTSRGSLAELYVAIATGILIFTLASDDMTVTRMA